MTWQQWALAAVLGLFVFSGLNTPVPSTHTATKRFAIVMALVMLGLVISI